MDRWTDLIPAVSLTRKIQPLPHSDLGPPEQNALGMNVSHPRSPFLGRTQSSLSLPNFLCGMMTRWRPLSWGPAPPGALGTPWTDSGRWTLLGTSSSGVEKQTGLRAFHGSTEAPAEASQPPHRVPRGHRDSRAEVPTATQLISEEPCLNADLASLASLTLPTKPRCLLEAMRAPGHPG